MKYENGMDRDIRSRFRIIYATHIISGRNEQPATDNIPDVSLRVACSDTLETVMSKAWKKNNIHN